MAQPLTTRKLRNLKLASGEGDYQWLLVALPDRHGAAIPVLRRARGVMVAVPDGLFSAEELEQGAIGEDIPDLGPVLQREVLVEGKEDGATVSVLVLDFPEASFSKLKVFSSGRRPAWPEGTVHFQWEDVVVRPDRDDLVEAVRMWVDDGLVRAPDEYHTALEDEAAPQPKRGQAPQADVLEAVLTQLQTLAAQVNTLQTDMGQMKAQQPAASNRAPGALGQIAKIAGKPPLTRAVPTPCPPAAPNPDLDGEEWDEEAGGLMEQTGDVDRMLKLALLKLVDKNTKSKKKKVGLALGASSGSDEEEDPLRRLSGAKGTLLQERLRQSMDNSPADYIAAIEALAASCLGQTTASPETMERYCREEMPIGQDRNMGHLVWVMTKAAGLLRAKQHEKAHLLLLLGLAAAEQFKLDQNWNTAWRLTHLAQPPFPEWRVRDPNLVQLRQDFAHSRLIHSTWAAAVSAKLKDEEMLVKRRGYHRTSNLMPEKGGGKTSEKGMGRGRGKRWRRRAQHEADHL